MATRLGDAVLDMHQWGYVVKPLKKNLISLFYEFRVNSENIARFRVKEMSGQISQFIWYRVNV